jgi:uncharacterized protein DUF4062
VSKGEESQRKVLYVFVPSPGDLREEREKFREVIDEVNRIKATSEDTLPGKGRPQSLINQDIEWCDLFALLLWKRWGSPSGTFSSGTEEEFELARKLNETSHGRPDMWLYFKSVPDDMLADPGKSSIEFSRFAVRSKQNAPSSTVLLILLNPGRDNFESISVSRLTVFPLSSVFQTASNFPQKQWSEFLISKWT